MGSLITTLDCPLPAPHLAARNAAVGIRRRRHSWHVAWIALATVLACGGPVDNLQGAVTIQDVQWGLGGRFKIGAWTPVVVRLQVGNSAVTGTLRVHVADGDEIQAAYGDSEPLEIAADESRTVVRYVRFGRQHASLRVEFVGSAGDITTWESPRENRPRGTITSRPLIGLIGPDLGFRARRAVSDRRASEEFEICDINPQQYPLPELAQGLDSLDLLVISAASPLCEAITPAALNAIQQWVLQGGRLVWHGSEGVSHLLATHEEWGKFLPGDWQGTTRLNRLAGLEGFFGAKEAIPIDRAGIPFVTLGNPLGVVRVSEGIGRLQKPLWIQAPQGFGQVTFIAIDLHDPALAQWTSKADLIDRLLAANLGHMPTGDDQSRHGQAAHLGYRDLSGQLRSAMDQFSTVHVFPVLLAGTIALGYLLLIGPVDYLLLARWLQRTTWTWLTFPLGVISCGGLIYGLNYAWKGNEWVMNTAQVIDLDQETGTYRGTAWLQLFGPQTTRVDVGFQAPTFHWSETVWTSWQGLPGDGFGGMDHAATVRESPDRYQHLHQSAQQQRLASSTPDGQWFPARTIVHDYPYRANSSHGFMTQWASAETGMAAFGEVKLRADVNGQLQGSFVNMLGVSLRDAWICHGRWAYRIPGTIASVPAQPIQIASLSNPRDIQALLTRRHYIKESGKDSRDVATAWDRSTAPVPEILRIMMLHEAAGGRDYTNLLNRAESRLDLSGHLHLGRAILVGVAERPQGTWELSGLAATARVENQWSFCRVVIPVEMPPNPNLSALSAQ